MRKLIAIGLGALFLMGGTVLYLRWFGGTLLQREVPSGAATLAEVRQNSSLSALDADYLSVKLRSGLLALPHEVFGATTYGGAVQAHWQDSSHLVVSLVRPSELNVYRRETTWRNVTITYEERQ